jgi:hypothetical protein
LIIWLQAGDVWKACPTHISFGNFPHIFNAISLYHRPKRKVKYITVITSSICSLLHHLQARPLAHSNSEGNLSSSFRISYICYKQLDIHIHLRHPIWVHSHSNCLAFKSSWVWSQLSPPK